MQYDWILFDADETLFSFDAFAGLKMTFSRLDVDFSKKDYIEYQVINQALWVKYQDGEVTAKQLQEKRFEILALRVGFSPAKLNHRFLEAMVELSLPLEGVSDIIPLLAKKAKLGIITNGFTQIQEARLDNTGLKKYFDWVVVSEEMGVAKPDPLIFESAFERMGKVNKSRILMVGDNPDSDILGANKVGIDSCWLNSENKTCSSSVMPTYEVRSWRELARLLLN